MRFSFILSYFKTCEQVNSSIKIIIKTGRTLRKQIV